MASVLNIFLWIIMILWFQIWYVPRQLWESDPVSLRSLWDHSFSTYAKFSENISYPLIRTDTCAYQAVRSVSFMENFTYVLNELSHTGKSVLDIAWYKFLFCVKNLGKCKNLVYMDFFYLFIYCKKEPPRNDLLNI